MTERKVYLKPLAVNLSGFGVIGQEPLGTCANGTNPTVAYCVSGDGVLQSSESCSPTGMNPTAGFCSTGGNVENNCTWGSIFS